MTNQEYKYLLCTYLIVSDEEIHSKELEFLSNFSYTPGNECKQEAFKIMSDDKDKISLRVITDSLRLENYDSRLETIELLIHLATYDGFFHNKERKFILDTSNALELHLGEVHQLIVKFESNIQIHYQEKKQSLYSNVKEKFFKKLHDITDNDFFEESLLEGNTFVTKVKEIALKASNDLDLASEKMLSFNQTLEHNFREIEKFSNKITTVESQHQKDSILDFINKLNKDTKSDILTSIRKNTEVLEKKKYTVDYFSIAFLGRTKAGKSTFHKVITGEQTDDVGVGKLRTTRYNRIFNWENIRIIDTPGIGAPGGKGDTEIARSIIDEADLVCYVVTNDAIQETEFNFLTELKDKNKPIFIILNFKENLEHPKRLERFLKNPKAWLENKDDKSLNGHIQRINEMISKFNYDPTLIEVIPIHLLAAKLAKEDQHIKVNKDLLQGSNINHYNKLIKQTIFRNGHLKKTQNIIDGCNYQTSLAYRKTKNNISELENLLKETKLEKKELITYFDQESKKTKQAIILTINSIHNQIRTDLKQFAKDEYENKDIGKAWQKLMNDKGYYDSLNLKIEGIMADFQKKILDKLKESLQDLSITITKLDIQHIDVDTTDYKFAANITFGVVGATLSTLAIANIWNPGGWILGAVAIGAFLVNFIFDSKDTRIKKAIDKVVNTIEPKINENEEKVVKNFEKAFIEPTQSLKNKLTITFDEMIEGLENILIVLKSINKQAKEHSDYFNKVLFFRSLEHMGKIKLNNLLTEEIVNKSLSSTTITRKKENLLVTTTYKLQVEELKQLNKALQLNITLN